MWLVATMRDNTNPNTSVITQSSVGRYYLRGLVESVNQFIYLIVINIFKRLSDSSSRHVPKAEVYVAFLVPLS